MFLIKNFSSLNKSYQELAENTIHLLKLKILDEIDNLIEENNLQFVEHQVLEEIKDDKISLVFNIFEGKKL